MAVPKLSNISLADFRKYLTRVGCTKGRTDGGHEMWIKKGLTRPITLQTHVDPVPERIVKQCLELLGIDRKDFDLRG